MNQTNQNDFKALITRLNDLAYKPMSPAQMIDLTRGFARVGYSRAEMIVRDIEHLEKIPANIYAAADNAARIVIEENQKNLYSRERWQALELCTSPDEFQLFFKIIALIIKIHADDLLPRNNAETVFVGPDLEAWVQMGRPQTWSPLVDQFLPGFEKLYKTNTLEEYLKRFYQFLKDNYKSRTDR